MTSDFNKWGSADKISTNNIYQNGKRPKNEKYRVFYSLTELKHTVFMVEAGRVELPSENASTRTSPGADGYCGSLALPVPVTPGKPSRPGVR